MKIALAQISTVAGQLDVTVERMVAQSHMAADRGARTVRVSYQPSVLAPFSL